MKNKTKKLSVEKDKEEVREWENILVSDIIKSVLNADEILEKTVVGIGSGAHINIPKKHLGKEAKVIISKNLKEAEVKKK